MLLDLAPLEGITGSLFRSLYHEFFPGIDRYYTPFISPTSDHLFTAKEQREILPENNEGMIVIPQLLTKNAADFLWAAQELHTIGYDEINLNLGCPSGTVTAKGKGAGMLADPAALDAFLDSIYSAAPCKISVKTRLGMEQPEEFEHILQIYEKYPLSELIIHPRVRKDFYRHPVRRESFEKIYCSSQLPLSYNGSIVSPQDYLQCAQKHPSLKAIMIGQGVIADPFLPGKIKYKAEGSKELLRQFHDRLVDAYTQRFGSRNNAVKRMKELWFYLSCSFENGEQYRKKILKLRSADDYDAVVSQIFSSAALLSVSTGDW